MVTGTLLLVSGIASDGTPHLYAHGVFSPPGNSARSHDRCIFQNSRSDGALAKRIAGIPGTA
jgi:hypothetical protein